MQNQSWVFKLFFICILFTRSTQNQRTSCLSGTTMAGFLPLKAMIFPLKTAIGVGLFAGGSRNDTSLRNLVIKHCPGLTSVSDCLRHLTALEDLWIHDTPELKVLSDDFQDLTSLQILTISRLPQMTCLPEELQQVARTLKNLHISSCPGLRSLPEWMDDKFTSLNYMEITNCHPVLYRRRAKETGEDWHKIAHC